MDSEPPPPQPDRRSFFKETAAILIGALSTLVPLVSGLVIGHLVRGEELRVQLGGMESTASLIAASVS